MKYRVKSVQVDAIPADEAIRAAMAAWPLAGDADADTLDSPSSGLPAWLVEAYERGVVVFTREAVHIGTPEASFGAMRGDWIIRGVTGHIFACDQATFAATYKQMTDPMDDEGTDVPAESYTPRKLTDDEVALGMNVVRLFVEYAKSEGWDEDKWLTASSVALGDLSFRMVAHELMVTLPRESVLLVCARLVVMHGWYQRMLDAANPRASRELRDIWGITDDPHFLRHQPESPNDFVNRRMKELDAKKKNRTADPNGDNND